MANENNSLIPMPENFGIFKSCGQDIPLTPDIIRQNFCPDLTDVELLNFGYLCQTNDLNPFKREAYVVKYKGSPASFIISKQGYSNRAEQSGHLKSKTGGIIEVRGVVNKDGTKGYETKEVEGEYVDPGWQVWGAWAIVERDDRDKPFVARVLNAEYSQSSNPLWKTKNCSMLAKVAMAHALREAFPCNMTPGAYYEEEFLEQQGGINRRPSHGSASSSASFDEAEEVEVAEEQQA